MSDQALAADVNAISRLSGVFKLRSGQVSSTYFDKYRFEAEPALLNRVAAEMLTLLPPGIEVLAGLELGGVPIATAMVFASTGDSMIREILKMGDPRLLRVARPVEDPRDPELKAIITDMYETMHAANGVGLAAPQIGVDLRLMIFGFEENPRYPDEPPVPVTTLINPWIEVLTQETEDGWEGCLSVPGMRGMVPRATRIRYGGTLQDGGALEREAHRFHARVFQHEFDHLNGVLYPQRIKDMTRFGFIEALFPQSPLAALEAE